MNPDEYCALCGQTIENQDYLELSLIRFQTPLCRVHFNKAKQDISIVRGMQSDKTGATPAEVAERAAKQLAAEKRRIIETGSFFR